MITWAYRHPEWVEGLAKRSKEIESSTLLNIPTCSGERSSVRGVCRVIERSEPLADVRSYALPLVLALWQNDAEDARGYVRRLAEYCSHVLECLCGRAFKGVDEFYVAVYNGRVNKTVRMLTEALGADGTEKLMALLNGYGYFKYYNEIGVRVDYRFEWLGEESTEEELDGETEGNAYFDTFAQIRMRFAVEPTVEPEDTVKERTVERKVPGENVNRTVVRTGDETRLFPYYVAMFVSGLLLLWLAFVSLRERKQEREEGAR
jgi:hypothetical protein